MTFLSSNQQCQSIKEMRKTYTYNQHTYANQVCIPYVAPEIVLTKQSV